MNVRQQFIRAALASTLLSMVGPVWSEPTTTGEPPKAQADTPGSSTGAGSGSGANRSTMPPWSMDDAPPAAGMRGEAAIQPDDDKASGASKGKKHKTNSKTKAKSNQGSASNTDSEPADPHGAYGREGSASSPR